MDENNSTSLMLRILEKVSALEVKVDNFNGRHDELKATVEKMEGRICTLERAPGRNWNKLTGAIIGAIGGVIGAGIVALMASQIVKP